MRSDGSDQDARYVLSKLLQRGTVAEYESEFLMLIKRVMIHKSLLKSFYISRLKLDLQCLLLRSNPKTLDEAFSLARAAETRFANLDIWKFLRSNPLTLGEDFFKACITEARFEIIAKEDKEHIVEKKIDVTQPLPLQGEFASPEVKGSLDADENIGVDEVSSTIDGVFDIGKSLVVFLKWVSISRSRPLLLLRTLEVVPYPDTTPNRVVSLSVALRKQGGQEFFTALWMGHGQPLHPCTYANGATRRWLQIVIRDVTCLSTKRKKSSRFAFRMGSRKSLGAVERPTKGGGGGGSKGDNGGGKGGGGSAKGGGGGSGKSG
ncbi:hypothetical protein Tco_0079019 [Tanacetum coccineum]